MSVYTTIYQSGNVTVRAIGGETPDAEDEWQSAWINQTSIFIHGLELGDLDDTVEGIEFRRQFALAALELAAESNHGFDMPQISHLGHAQDAGCGGCLCSPGFLTYGRVTLANEDGEREMVDIHITLAPGALT